MRYLFIVFVLFPSLSFAKDFTFTWAFKESQNYEELNLLVKDQDSYEAAFEKAAKFCYNHFKRQNYTTDQMLDVIDTCANPKSKWGQ